ncbi:hypothetical protein PAXINDRAFT_167814 [Paxillus involutus ATCC 200175]|nr:hypothetical protein PAXINDRAFT_167814 [Paxillus involutus ATCC 200175]
MPSTSSSQYNNSSTKSSQQGYHAYNGSSNSSSSPQSGHTQSGADPRAHSYAQSSKYGPQRTTVSAGASTIAPVFF